MDWTFLAGQLEGTIVNGMNDVSYPKKKKKKNATNQCDYEDKHTSWRVWNWYISDMILVSQFHLDPSHPQDHIYDYDWVNVDSTTVIRNLT